MENNHFDAPSTLSKKPLDALNSVMTREISLMREMLSNSLKEQEAILANDIDMIKAVASEKEQIFETMMKLKDQRITIIRTFTKLLKTQEREEDSMLSEGEVLKNLLQETGNDRCDLISLTDQMVCLLDKIKDQINRNDYLLKNKITFTKQFLVRLSSQDDHPTYQNNGMYKKKSKKVAVTLINREV